MFAKHLRGFALVVAAAVAAGSGTSASAAGPQPGSQAATAALAFNPFSKSASASGGSSTLVVASGSAAVRAPVVVKDHASPHEPLPNTTITIHDVTVTEPDTGHTTVRFSVTMSKPSPVPVRVDFRTRNGEARGNHVDYIDAFGTVLFPPGSQQQFVSVQIEGDTIQEFAERFYVDLNNPRPSPVTIARRTGTGLILDNDPQSRGPRITVAVKGSSTVTEGNSGTTNVGILVYLSERPTRPVGFSYTTANGSATSPSDYSARSGRQVFEAGSTVLARGFDVPVVGDRVREANETFQARISDVTNAIVGNSSVTVTIRNDD